jgi:hypothetical protein
MVAALATRQLSGRQQSAQSALGPQKKRSGWALRGGRPAPAQGQRRTLKRRIIISTAATQEPCAPPCVTRTQAACLALVCSCVLSEGAAAVHAQTTAVLVKRATSLGHSLPGARCSLTRQRWAGCNCFRTHKIRTSAFQVGGLHDLTCNAARHLPWTARRAWGHLIQAAMHIGSCNVLVPAHEISAWSSAGAGARGCGAPAHSCLIYGWLLRYGLGSHGCVHGRCLHSPPRSCGVRTP